MRAAHTAPADLIAAPTSPVEQAKRLAARTAIDEYVKTGMSVGVGSGSTIVYGIQRLAERVHGEEGLVIRCIPTSFQSRQVRAEFFPPLPLSAAGNLLFLIVPLSVELTITQNYFSILLTLGMRAVLVRRCASLTRVEEARRGLAF
jgi:hypothetical protein